tara:strand:- start:921 stop:1916 length:996 start_codon:yes stop_codon:yes gene_type:complete
MPSQEILILSYIKDGSLEPSGFDLLNPAAEMANQNGMKVSIAVLGTQDETIAQECFHRGADKVYFIPNEILTSYNSDSYVYAMTCTADKVDPAIILISRNMEGRELAARVAFRLGTGLAQDCLEVSIDTDTNRMLANRPVYGGSAIAIVDCKSDPQMAAIRPKAYEALEPESDRTGEVEVLEIEIPDDVIKVQTVETVTEEAEGIQLEDARIVVAGGRGLGGPEPFEQLGELADLLEGAVGASRAAVDSGWIPHSQQVGLTGKTITPDVYITVAISGASQHMAGCTGSKVIVAINKDPEANIFKDAKYGIVGDWENILPALTETVRELTQS